MNEKTELQQWYEANPAPSMSMCANTADYLRAMYEYREAEAHQLSEEIIRLRAASPSSKSTQEDAARDLHQKIMNIPCTGPGATEYELRDGYAKEWDAGYRYGHRDARHAAAELALASSSIKESGGGVAVLRGGEQG